jgi:hypothetical protein
MAGTVLAATLALASGPAAAQSEAPATAAVPGGAAGGQQEVTYTSYLAAPAQDNVMLRGSLDADELIGSEVVGADGARLGSITDLLVGPDGQITHAAVDAGQALGAGSRHVAVELARLQRAEAGPLTFRLDMDRQQLASLAAYRQNGDRWEQAR